MKRLLAGLLLAAAPLALPLLEGGCADDTCRLDILTSGSGDPVTVEICASCNEGEDPEGEKRLRVELLPNADSDVGCRCTGQTCVFCVGECNDPVCLIETETNEADGCTPQLITLDLDGEDFDSGFRLPITIDASSSVGGASEVVFLMPGAPTPTPTATPEEIDGTPTPEPSAAPTPSPTPTDTPLLPIP